VNNLNKKAFGGLVFLLEKSRSLTPLAKYATGFGMTFFVFFAARLKPCPDEGESQRRSQNRPLEKRRGRYIRQIQRQDAALGLGALKRRPYKDGLRKKLRAQTRLGGCALLN